MRSSHSPLVLKQVDCVDWNNGQASALKQHLFHDETLPSFFRRLAWSPDASFLVVPSGIFPTIHTCMVPIALSNLRRQETIVAGVAYL